MFFILLQKILKRRMMMMTYKKATKKESKMSVAEKKKIKMTIKSKMLAFKFQMLTVERENMFKRKQRLGKKR